MTDLLDAGLIEPGEILVFSRRRLGETTVEANGTVVLPDGRVSMSRSLAAMRAANLVSNDEWIGWRVPRLNGIKLDDLRQKLIATASESPEPA